MKLQYVIFLMAATLLPALGQHNRSINQTCNHIAARCDRAQGLRCNPETEKCECVPTEVFDKDNNYTMEWDESENRCAGALGSVCIGTPSRASPADVTVHCKSGLTCAPLENRNDYIGVCGSKAGMLISSVVVLGLGLLLHFL